LNKVITNHTVIPPGAAMAAALLIDLHPDYRRFWPDYLIPSLKKNADYLRSSMEKANVILSKDMGSRVLNIFEKAWKLYEH
jgi:hypothetical protein